MPTLPPTKTDACQVDIAVASADSTGTISSFSTVYNLCKPRAMSSDESETSSVKSDISSSTVRNDSEKESSPAPKEVATEQLKKSTLKRKEPVSPPVIEIPSKSATSSEHSRKEEVTLKSLVGPTGCRKGKWTTEEEKYATTLIHYFRRGLLDLSNGTTLRYLFLFCVEAQRHPSYLHNILYYIHIGTYSQADFAVPRCA